MRMRRRSAATLVALTLAGGCGSDLVVRGEIPVLTLAPTSVVLLDGTSTAVGVTVDGRRDAPTTFRWVSSAPAIVTVDSATATAAQTRLHGVVPGSAVITLIVVRDGQTVTASLPVTVHPHPGAPLAITVTPVSATIGVGDTVRILPFIPVSSATQDVAVTFASLDTTTVTVDSTGLVTGRRAGIASVRVSPRAQPNDAAVATITVRAP